MYKRTKEFFFLSNAINLLAYTFAVYIHTIMNDTVHRNVFEYKRAYIRIHSLLCGRFTELWSGNELPFYVITKRVSFFFFFYSTPISTMNFGVHLGVHYILRGQSCYNAYFFCVISLDKKKTNLYFVSYNFGNVVKLRDIVPKLMKITKDTYRLFHSITINDIK